MPDITTLCVIIAAVIEAMETGLKKAPELSKRLPDVITSELWGFVPLGLLIVAGGVWLFRNWRYRGEPSNFSHPAAQSPFAPLGQVWQWTSPSAEAVLAGIEELETMPLRLEVRVLSESGGYEIANLLVTMFRRARWKVQANPADLSAVFPLQRGDSRRGIFLRYHGQAYLAVPAQPVFVLFFKNLLGITIEGIIEMAGENLLQIEVGSRPD